MNVRKPILLLTFLLAWLGGVNCVWADYNLSYNNYVSYYQRSSGFDIMFKVNGTGDWQSTTFGNDGYKTVIKINDGAEQSIGYGNFQFGTVYKVGGIEVSIEASIADATTKAVTVQYNIKNTNSSPVKLQIGSWADTQVGSDDHATITREGQNTIMMTASGGAMYGITAGTDPFTTLWYGYYGSADDNVFNDNQGHYQGTSTDSGLAWSWTINSLPAGGEKIIAFGGLASQKGAVSMASYKYGTTPATPTVSGITGNPSITYYYNTTNTNSGGTVWSGITGTTLNAGTYYMYAYIGATSTSAAMTTPTTPFTVAKGDYNMNGITFPNGTFTYDGNPHSLAISGTLPTGVSVSYTNNNKTNAGTYTVTANFTSSNSNYNPPSPSSLQATLTINKVTPQASDFSFTPPSNLVYDRDPKPATVVTNLSAPKTGMGAVTVYYYKGATSLGTTAPRDVGTYTVKINVAEGTNYNAANNNITASNWTFTIVPRQISTVTITVADMEWTGSVLSKTQNATDGYTIKYKNIDLVLNTEYTFHTVPAAIKEPGNYIIYFTGIGNFTGTIGRAFIVTKDISSQATSSPRSQYQIIPNGSTSVVPDIEITDDATGATLVQGTDFTISPATVSADVSTTVTITGMAPKYRGTSSINIKGLKEYYIRSTSPNTSVVDLHLVETTATGANAILGNTGPNAVIETNSTALTIPATVNFATPGATITITGIEDGAFTGCSSLRHINATAVVGYEPTSLLRDIEASPFYGVPKQALVYLNGTNITGENYVYDPGTGSYYCDIFKIYDELNGNQQGFSDANDYKWGYENIYDFTANTIINTRMLTEGQHYTTCLPYALPIPADMKAYTLSASSEKLLGFEEVTTGTLAAYTPYVIIPSTSGQLLGTTDAVVPAFTASDDDAKKLGPVTAGNFKMGGTMRYIDGPDAESFYIMQGKKNGVCTWMKIHSATSNTGASPVNPCVLPMRAYIKSGTTLSREFIGSTFTNGVSERMPKDLSDDDNLYDLLGRKVQTPQRRGVYIKNGRKVVIKKEKM